MRVQIKKKNNKNDNFFFWLLTCTGLHVYIIEELFIFDVINHNNSSISYVDVSRISTGSRRWVRKWDSCKSVIRASINRRPPRPWHLMPLWSASMPLSKITVWLSGALSRSFYECTVRPRLSGHIGTSTYPDKWFGRIWEICLNTASSVGLNTSYNLFTHCYSICNKLSVM